MRACSVRQPHNLKARHVLELELKQAGCPHAPLGPLARDTGMKQTFELAHSLLPPSSSTPRCTARRTVHSSRIPRFERVGGQDSYYNNNIVMYNRSSTLVGCLRFRPCACRRPWSIQDSLTQGRRQAQGPCFLWLWCVLPMAQPCFRRCAHSLAS